MEIQFEKDAVMVPVHVNETGYEKRRPPQLNKDNQPPAQIAGGPAETDPHVGVIEVHMARFTFNEDGYVDMDITDTVIPCDATDDSGNTGRAAEVATAVATQTDLCQHMMVAAHAATTVAPAAPSVEPVQGLTHAELEFHLRRELATYYSSDINDWTQGAMPRYCHHLFPAGPVDGSMTSLHGNNINNDNYSYNHSHTHNNYSYNYNHQQLEEDDIDLNDVAPGHWA